MNVWALVRLCMCGLFIFTAVGCPLSASAFKVWPSTQIHEGITDEALSKVVVSLSDERKIGIEPSIRQVIAENNAIMDLIHFDKADIHFDNERLLEGSKRVIEKRAIVIDRIARRDFMGARAILGGALHTLQDFYAHTDWSNLYGATTTTIFLGDTPLGEPSPDDVKCGQSAYFQTLKLTSGYFSLLQFFGSSGLFFWTNSYPEGASGEWPLNKCIHGSTDGGGLHKDTETRMWHFQAYSAAVTSTKEYVDAIVAGVKGKVGSAQADELLCHFATGAECPSGMPDESVLASVIGGTNNLPNACSEKQVFREGAYRKYVSCTPQFRLLVRANCSGASCGKGFKRDGDGYKFRADCSRTVVVSGGKSIRQPTVGLYWPGVGNANVSIPEEPTLAPMQVSFGQPTEIWRSGYAMPGMAVSESQMCSVAIYKLANGLMRLVGRAAGSGSF